MRRGSIRGEEATCYMEEEKGTRKNNNSATHLQLMAEKRRVLFQPSYLPLSLSLTHSLNFLFLVPHPPCPLPSSAGLSLSFWSWQVAGLSSWLYSIYSWTPFAGGMGRLSSTQVWLCVCLLPFNCDRNCFCFTDAVRFSSESLIFSHLWYVPYLFETQTHTHTRAHTHKHTNTHTHTHTHTNTLTRTRTHKHTHTLPRYELNPGVRGKRDSQWIFSLQLEPPK